MGGEEAALDSGQCVSAYLGTVACNHKPVDIQPLHIHLALLIVQSAACDRKGGY